jgi:hypothetical protein
LKRLTASILLLEEREEEGKKGKGWRTETRQSNL